VDSCFSPAEKMKRRTFLKQTAAIAAAATTAHYLPSASAGTVPVSPVAVRRCPKYDPNLIYDTLGQMFTDLGGISTMVNGKNVSIKINCVSLGNYNHSLHTKYTQTTNPDVVYAACRLFLAAGAARINIMEGFQTTNPISTVLPQLGYDQAAFEALGNGNQVRFYSTRNKETDPPNTDSGFAAYTRVDTLSNGIGSGDPYLFDYFYFNRMWLAPKTDVIVSIPKMKGHSVGGVTLSIKNMFGCTPPTIYGGTTPITLATGPDENCTTARNASCHLGTWTPVGERTGHGVVANACERIPRLLVDLNRALPVSFAIIDGITGVQSEMGPGASTSVTTPGVLIAGTNVVCVDSVAVGVMGGNPMAAAGTDLWPSGQNHIALAAAKALGSNDLSLIPVLGDSIASVRYDYYPTVNLASDNPVL